MKKPEIHAIRLDSADLTVDYRPSDRAIIISVAGEEVLRMWRGGLQWPQPSGIRSSFTKLYDAIEPDIKALHEWMVSRHNDDVRDGIRDGSYIGIRCVVKHRLEGEAREG